MRTAVQITSIQAHQHIRVKGIKTKQETLILDLIKSIGGDWSISEIASCLAMEKSTVSGRRNELLKSGHLELAPERKCTITGIKISPVKLPAGQGELFA